MVTYGDQLVKSVRLELELSVGPAQRWALEWHQKHMSPDETSGSCQAGSAATVTTGRSGRRSVPGQNRPQGKDVTEESHGHSYVDYT